MKVFILGRTEYLFDTALLLSEKHRICGIATAKAMPEYSVKEEDFRKLADRLSCPFHYTDKITDELKDFIKSSAPDICVSVNWVTVLKEDVINLFPKGILNAHFGDLPSYRGNAVINWAILNNEDKIAVTIHQMVPGEIDSGPVWLKDYLNVTKNTTISEVVRFCREKTPELFLRVVNGIENNTLKPTEQDKLNLKPFRCYPRLPEYSKINWSHSAEEIHNLIRASSKPYSGAYTYLKIEDEIKKVYIWESQVVNTHSEDIAAPGHIIKNNKATGESWVMTGKGILSIKSAQYEGEDEFKPGLKWKSIRMHFGFDPEDEIYKLIIKRSKTE
ncbi:MAG: formyltransferase family protein [Ignavibacteria bacterium]|nr:formyltransferase family protein [Ignavibacteria bacterium]